MSTVSDQVKCPQCGYEEADHEFDCRSSEEETLCTRCGYRESWKAQRDGTGQFSGWKHETIKGCGTLWYRATDGVAFACHSLHAEKELAEAERWLKQQLDAGTVDENTARLTRWNEEASRVELVVGTLDYAGRMEQVVADLGLNPIKSSPGKLSRFAILPGKAAVIGKSSSLILPVLHYLNADPSNGKYSKRADGSMQPIEYELAYLAVSPSELKEISKLQNEASSRYGLDMVFVPNGDFGREFYRVSNIARWTQDPAIAKRVQETASEASSEFVAKCASRSDIEMLPDLPAAYPKGKNPVSSAAPMNNRSGVDAQMPVTLDEWHRALGIYKCLACGIPLLKGTKYVWQGRNRWCEKCFWGEDSEDAITEVPAESGARDKEDTDVDQRGN